MTKSLGDIAMVVVIQRILDSYGPMLGMIPTEKLAEQIVTDLDAEIREPYENPACDVVDSIWHMMVGPDPELIRDRKEAIAEAVHTLKKYRIYRLK